MSMPVSNYIAVLAVVIGATLLNGCATKKHYLNDTDRAGLRSQPTIAVVHYATPLPEVQAPKAHVAPHTNIKLHDTPTGAEIQSNLGSYDPTVEVAQRFSTALARSAGLKNLRMEHEAAALPPVKDPKALQGRYKNGVVMEIWIERWGFHYVPVDWKTYTLTLSAKARLTRVADGQVLWNTGDCHYAGTGNNYNDRIVLADLKSSESRKTQAKFKQVMGQIADGCAQQLLQDYAASR